MSVSGIETRREMTVAEKFRRLNEYSQKMHPFHRVVRHMQSHITTSKQNRDIRDNGEYSEREDDPDESSVRDKSRKTSPNRRKELLDARYAECVQMSASVTQNQTNQQSNKANNALRAKETILWSNSYTERDDNGERLGLNKNNIIKESLKSGK